MASHAGNHLGSFARSDGALVSLMAMTVDPLLLQGLKADQTLRVVQALQSVYNACNPRAECCSFQIDQLVSDKEAVMESTRFLPGGKSFAPFMATAILFVCHARADDSLSGSWQGVFKPGGRVSVGMDLQLDASASGGYEGAYVWQFGAKGQAKASLEGKKTTIQLTQPGLSISFAGTLSEDGNTVAGYAEGTDGKKGNVTFTRKNSKKKGAE